MKSTKIYKVSDEGPFEDHVWKYNLKLPNHLADWDVWDYWEKPRTEHMAQQLNKDSVIFDVGTEQGAMSALISKYISPKIILIEPSYNFWATIKAIWEENKLKTPLGFFDGFASEKSDENITWQAGWPIGGKVLSGGMPYKYLHNPRHKKRIQTVSLDDLSKYIGIVPDALNIDVEGAELLVLRGAKKLLENYDMKIWVSIHPDLLGKDYGSTTNDIFNFMNELGYMGETLALDHETHVYFSKFL